MNEHDHEDNIRGLVDGYVHGLLDHREHDYVRRRIRESDVWAAAHREALRRRQLLEGAPALEPDEKLIAATLARVEAEGPVRDRVRRLLIGAPLAVAAALILLFVAVNAYFGNLEPSPYNLRVVGQRSLLAGTDASIRVHLSAVEPGARVGDRDVRVQLSDPETGEMVRLAEFRTDGGGTGSPRFAVPDWPEGVYELTVLASTPRGTERLVREVELERANRVLVSTDKPVYQPGQTILARAYALRRLTGEPLAGEVVVFEVNDANGNLIFRERTVASPFGIASMECAIDTLAAEGDYTLRCRVSSTESVRTVRVERYVLPKFRVGVTLDRSYYEPGDAVRGDIDARYFFGEAVAGGRAAVSVNAQVAGEAQTIASTEVVLDADGVGSFALRLPGRLLGSAAGDGDASIEIEVRVIDAAGQAVERVTRRVVTTRPLRVHMVAENGVLVPGMQNRVFVFATLADGTPADARVMIEGHPDELRTGDDGVASFMVSAVPPDGVSLVVRATDGEGRTVNTSLDLGADGAADAFVVRTDAARYDAGDTVTVSVFGGGDMPVFVDLVRGGQTVLTERIDVRSGLGEIEIDLPADISGVVRLVAYRFDGRGWSSRRDRVLVVRPPREVAVQVEGVDEPYRPGERAQLRVRLTDGHGAPRPGAVSLAIVDEAVFNVGGASSLTRTFDAIDEELLAPIYAVYPWDPFEERPGSDEGVLLEQAVAALGSARGKSDRDRLMQSLVDQGLADEHTLRVLESDRLDELLEQSAAWLSPETVEVLRGAGDSVFTLRAASYPAKAREAEQRKQRWAKTRSAILRTTGAIVGVGLLFAMVVGVARSKGGKGLVEAFVVVIVLVLLVGIMLPSLGRARQSARLVRDATALRSLGMALELDGVDLTRDAAGLDDSASAGTRVREWFPETLLWRPELVSDDDGVVMIEVPLADSITNWKVSASAVTRRGQVGSATADLTVFQPFFVDIDAPVALTRGDSVSLPVVVYNYLDRAQDVEIRLSPESWFELDGDAGATLTLGPREVRSAAFRIRAVEIGAQRVLVRARGAAADGSEVRDAVRRDLRVVPEGIPVERAVNGNLDEAAELKVAFPAHAVPGSGQATLKLYPSSFSQVLEGLDGIFRRPHGCFEQTSSTTYPNILALDYLRRTGANAPGVEARAMQFIHLGYQRLISFEVDGGGFDWFGHPPANRTLTAYGLMQFEDMARVRDVDPALIERTRAWLFLQQKADGSWDPEHREMHDGPTARDRAHARLATTAYIAWAAFARDDAASDRAQRARDFLLGTAPGQIDDPYTLALVGLALQRTGGETQARRYTDRLASIARSNNADRAWWERTAGGRTMFYGSGRSADVEATSLAVLALMEAGSHPALVRDALGWLVAQRDPAGTWGTTQATVLALRALVEATGAPLGTERPRRIEIRQGAGVLRTLDIQADQSDVMRLIDLSGLAGFDPREPIVVEDLTRSGTAYQLAMTHHEVAPAGGGGAIEVDVVYARDQLVVGDVLSATARVGNTSGVVLPMVMLEVPVPPGFEPVVSEFDRLVSEGLIARYDMRPRSVTLYLRRLGVDQAASYTYALRAIMPVEAEAPAPTAYEYYDPDKRAAGSASTLVVR